MKPVLSMSALNRAEKCPASAVLPGVTRVKDEIPKGKVSPATRGTVAHDYLKNVPLLGVAGALEAAEPQFREGLEAIDVASLPACEPEAFIPEVGLAWDWEADTGRELFRGDSSRDYSGVKPTEICGTVDSLGLTADAVLIADYKTGYRWLGPAAESLQLLGYALAACRAYGRSRAHVRFLRINDAGDVLPIKADLDFLDLEAAAARIRAIVSAVREAGGLVDAGKPVRFTEGEHCRFCDVFKVCPAKTQLALAVGNQVGLMPPVLNIENFPEVLQRYEAAAKVLDKVKESLDDFARLEAVPLGDGSFFGAVEEKKETIDPVKGAALLGQHFDAELAASCVEQTPELTKVSLERQLKRWVEAHPEGPKVTPLMKATVEMLRKGKAISAQVYQKVRRFRPKALKSGEAA